MIGAMRSSLRQENSRRGFVCKAGVLVGALPFAAFGQQSTAPHIRRIAFLIGGQPALIDVFREALRAKGYVEGQNLLIDLRVASGPEMPKQAAEVARSNAELVVAAALPYALEVRRANPKMPMVIGTAPGMVSNGFAKSLEHPGGNTTGMDELPSGITAKRLTLLKSADPRISRVALLSTTPGQGGHEAQLAEAKQAAPALGVTVKPYRAATLNEIETALAQIAADRMEGLLNFQGGLSLANLPLIVDFATRQRIPAIYQATLFPEGGGLMAWAPDLNEQFRIAAEYVDQILKGANPGDLPMRHPARYYLTVNMSAARKIGVTLPAALLAQTDRVIP
jgi:putative ABC transport system substrate-binding protein